ncbi:hypothetical protein QO002_001725 [Pararhizobium capsulatum DSM 1112]|uniref:Uncharacterized protein n=1 Tax=Pararhizobium capsulatum DSM 1112 TaxID=1121113 RepID=A0ABU0BMV1_9HYPH|nr:hypothetical protein [Pararhizobium capsulatum]MDQ0319587.1 hypothetical protein [Pararhizobium capsulatum DSM 1112]
MADIIRIEERLPRFARRMPTDVATKAEILLFTGIRYERLDKTETVELDSPVKTGGKKH